MKASWLKFVLIGLFAAGVVACGKDNKAANGVGTNAFINDGVSQPVSTNSYDEFRQQVANGAFLSLPSQFVRYDGVDLSYTWKKNFIGIYYCAISQDGYKDRIYANGTYTHELGTTASAIHSAIVQIVNSPQNVARLSATRYMIRHANFDYVIDLALPLVANPVSKKKGQQDANSQGCIGQGYEMMANPQYF
tara:strand:- start:4899 stop:5474 length:576 start_codon:yes stop_codon:yes gene_type:complete